MIQRIQSVFLLIQILIDGIGIGYFMPDWLDGEPYIFFGFIINILVALWILLLFKNRGKQIQLLSFNGLISVILLIISIYYLLKLSGDSWSEKGIEFFGSIGLAVSGLVLIVLANHAIKKDEKLVKSVDRIR